MTGKGLKSRMSDECLMKQETVFSFYTQYQAVMRKFTLAGKSEDGNNYLTDSWKSSICSIWGSLPGEPTMEMTSKRQGCSIFR